jgi:fatty-acyl-CoA synthase
VRTFVDAIAKAAEGGGVVTVLGADCRIVSSLPWLDVHERARRMSSVLRSQSIGPGSRIALHGDISLDLVIAVQAGWLAGAAVTVLPPASPGGDNIRAIVADAGFHAVVTDSSSLPIGATARLSLSGLVNAGDRAVPSQADRPDPSDLAILQYQAGSSRRRWGVPVTHGRLASGIEALKTATGHDTVHPARVLSWLPLHHDMGLIGFLALPMSCGCSLYLQPPGAFAARPASWLEAMTRFRITVSGAPNLTYGLMARLLATRMDLDLHPLRLLLCAGEPVSAAMMTEFAEAAKPYGLDGAAMVPAYGHAEAAFALTAVTPGSGVRVDRIDRHELETGGRAIAPSADARVRTLVRLGKPLPGIELRILSRGGEPAGPRTVGHIEVRGSSVAGHRWGEPAPQEGDWLHTGDLGYLTENGELVVCGRGKDVLFAAGRKVFPQDLEEAAVVRRSAAFALPRNTGGGGDGSAVRAGAHGVKDDTVRRAVTAAVLDEVGLAYGQAA